jgi:hypothetical protein
MCFPVTAFSLASGEGLVTRSGSVHGFWARQCLVHIKRDACAYLLTAANVSRDTRRILAPSQPTRHCVPPYMGEALLMARGPELQPLIDHLREQAQGRDDITSNDPSTFDRGSWFAKLARRGEDLIAAGLSHARMSC